MALITLQVGAEYATGTVVSVYNTTNSVPGAPVGSVVTTGTVGSDGNVTFAGLSEGLNYLAYSPTGNPSYVRFYVPAAIPSSGGSGSGTISAWVSGASYTAGQPVISGGAVYTANNDHVAGASFAGDQSAHWTVLPPLLSSSVPLANSGAGSAGTSGQLARADHVHPSASGILLPSALYVAGVGSSNSSVTLTKNREYCIGLDLAPQRISRFALCPSTVENPSTLRVGLRSDLNLQPGPPVADQTITVTSTGWKETPDFAYDHPGGLLWLSVVGQGWVTTAMALRGIGSFFASFIRPWAIATQSTLANMPLGETVMRVQGVQDGVTGALPNTFVQGFNAKDYAFEFYVKRA